MATIERVNRVKLTVALVSTEPEDTLDNGKRVLSLGK
jgi:hypothetical protein